LILDSRHLYKIKDDKPYLTLDARSACRLLVIDPEQLEKKEYESFAERGLPQVRQQLRFEHYEEKRRLKIKALENLIRKSRQKDTEEGLLVSNLLQEMRESNPKSSAEKRKRSRPLSGFSSSHVNDFHNNNNDTASITSNYYGECFYPPLKNSKCYSVSHLISLDAVI
jgi:hypothetical protein